MTSPAVWASAWAIATAAAQADGRQVLDPAAQNKTVPDAPYWLLETASSTSDRAGAGEPVNLEDGTVWLHLMVPRGTGSLAALTSRKAMSDAFRAVMRAAETERPANLPVGLYYHGHSFDPPNLDQDGNRVRFSLGIDYEYQDILT